jgi:hypothetical protein
VADSDKINFSTTVMFWQGATWPGLSMGWTLTIGALFSFLATIILLTVEKVHWSSPQELSDESSHSMRLLDIRNKRTIRYRIAWQLSMYSIVLLAINVYLVARTI